MSSIATHISTLLYDHNCVVLPGFGGFVANYQSAKMHPASNIFNCPSKSIAFNVNLQHNDGLLQYHIVTEENISALDAEMKMKEYVQEIKHNLEIHKAFKLPSIGRFVIDIEGNISFLPDSTNNYLQNAYGLYTIHAEPVLRDKNTAIKHVEKIKIKPETEPKRIRRFLYPAAAILLFALVVLQLFVQTNRNGYNISEVFGIDMLMKNHIDVGVDYYPAVILNTTYLKNLRATEIPAIDTLSVTPILEENIHIDKPTQYVSEKTNSAYSIIAGVYGKEEYTKNIIIELELMNYNPTLINKNNLFMISIDIPQNERLVEFRNKFATETGISDAWVMKK